MRKNHEFERVFFCSGGATGTGCLATVISESGWVRGPGLPDLCVRL